LLAHQLGIDRRYGIMDMHDEDTGKSAHCKTVTTVIGNIRLSLQLRPKCGSGERLWSSVIILAGYLQRNAEIVRNKAILELGAGTGVTGLISSTLGATSVTLTDREGEVLDQLRRNVDEFCEERRNSIGTLPVSPCAVHDCEWNAAAMEGVAGAPFDLVLGADITFNPDTFDALLETLLRVTDGSSVVLLSERRRLRGLFEEDFFEDIAPSVLAVRRLDVVETTVRIAREARLDGDAAAAAELAEAGDYVRIYELRRPDIVTG
jgi:predicted nicotinamide N-methyase